MEYTEKNLLNDWELFTYRRNILSPTVADLTEFLKELGYNKDVVDELLLDMEGVDIDIEFYPCPPEEDTEYYKFTGLDDLTDRQKRIFAIVTGYIQALSTDQKHQLHSAVSGDVLEDIDDFVVKMHDLIKSARIEEYIVSYLETILPVMGTIEESTDHQRVQKLLKTVPKKSQPKRKLDVEEYIQKWEKDIRQCDAMDKLVLMRAVIHGMARCPNRANNYLLIKSVNKSLKKAKKNPLFVRKMFDLKNGQIMEKDFYLLATRFLLQCGKTWVDFNLRPYQVNERYIRFHKTMGFGGRDLLVEDIFQNLLKIQNTHNTKNIYGRRMKDVETWNHTHRGSSS